MSYLKGNDLITIFETEADFYNLNVSGRSHLCRRALRLRRKNVVAEKADAVFIISSPGSCKPLDIKVEDIDSNYSKVQPKLVEHQMMRLMEKMQWNLTYVINLSDLCGRREAFNSNLHYVRCHSDDYHTIFSLKRVAELSDKLSLDTHIIACWGANALLKEDAADVLTLLSERGKVHGMRHEISPYYYQPTPFLKIKGKEWLEEMDKQMRGLLAGSI